MTTKSRRSRYHVSKYLKSEIFCVRLKKKISFFALTLFQISKNSDKCSHLIKVKNYCVFQNKSVDIHLFYRLFHDTVFISYTKCIFHFIYKKVYIYV